MEDTEYHTTITLRSSTRDRLKDRGKKGESYDEVLTHLLDATELTPDPVDPDAAKTTA